VRACTPKHEDAVHRRIVVILAQRLMLRCFRRFVWNFFRLENEHLNNCGQFRAVRDISIAPMNSNDQALLEQMMDDEDGVINRRRPVDRKYRTVAASNRSANYHTAVWRLGVMVNNIVTLRRARLVPGWVTDCLAGGKTSRYIQYPGQLSLPSVRGRLVRSLTGCVHLCHVAGNTV